MLLKHFFEIGKDKMSETLPVLDLRKCDTTDVFSINAATPTYQPENCGVQSARNWDSAEVKGRCVIQVGDVLCRADAEWIYVSNVLEEITAPSHVTILRRKLNAPSGFPAFLLPFFAYENRGYWVGPKHIKMEMILNTKVDPVPTPPKNADRLLETSRALIAVSKQQIKLLEERHRTIGRMLVRNEQLKGKTT